MTTTVTRLRAPSGNRDADYWRATCTCGWRGAMNPNRTIEGRRLADRDARQHRCPTTDRVPTADDRDRIARCLRALTDSTGALSVAAAVRDGESTFILVSEIEALLDIAEAAEAAAEEARGEMGGTAADRRAFRADYPATARLADLFPARDTGIE